MTIELDGKVYGVYSSCLAFLVVFRNGKAYSRWWDGVQAMTKLKTDWVDACAQIVAATVVSKKPEEKKRAYCHVLARLFSILSCIAFKHIADMKDEKFEILNMEGLDPETMALLWGSPERPRHLMPIVEQWILNHVHHGMADGIVAAPPPIVNRFFTGLHSGMVGVKQCYLISFTLFPTPYAFMVNALLVVHLIYTAAFAVAVQGNLAYMCPMVFCVIFAFWCINLIAMEIEHPFGDDVNDINLHAEQCEINHHLLLLLDPRSLHTPSCADFSLLNGPAYRNCMYSTDVMKDGGNPENTDSAGGMAMKVFNNLDSGDVECFDGTNIPLDPELAVAPPTALSTVHATHEAMTGLLGAGSELHQMVSRNHQGHQQLAEGILEQLKQQGQANDVMVRIQERQNDLLVEIAESCSRFFKEAVDMNYGQASYSRDGKTVELSSCTPWVPFATVNVSAGTGAQTRRSRVGRLGGPA